VIAAITSVQIAGHFREAEKVLGRAVAMDASDSFAREDLHVCEEKISTVRRLTHRNKSGYN
jgi:hypothetical protein